MRDEIGLMSDGSAFQARGPAMEKALSYKNNMKHKKKQQYQLAVAHTLLNLNLFSHITVNYTKYIHYKVAGT